MKKIADAIFEFDETNTVTHLVDHNSKATLRQVRSYWSDNDIPRLAGVSETDIATLPSDELQKRVAEFWGEDIANRADRFAEQPSQEDAREDCKEAGRGGVLLKQVFAVAACFVAAAFVASIFLRDGEMNAAEIQLDRSIVSEPSVTRELPERDVVRMAGILPLEGVGSWPTYAPDLQLNDAALLSTRSTPGEGAWMVDLEFKGERYQIVSITLGDEFANPYEALEELGFDGNVREAFSSRLVSAEDIDARRLQIGDRFLSVLQESPSVVGPSFVSLSYFPYRRTASLSGLVSTCGTGNVTFSEPGLILAALEMRTNVVSRAVTNCGSVLEVATNAVLNAGQ